MTKPKFDVSDRRSARTRRFRQIVDQLQNELGDDVSGPEMALIEQTALLILKSELIRDAILQGGDVPEESLVRIANAVGRAVRELRGAKGKRQKSKPTLLQQMISERTKAALAAAKARGVKLGGPKLAQARKVAVAAIEAAADNHAANVLPLIREIKKAGATTLREIADALNARGVSTARGGRWHAMTVSNVLARA
jgi:hypothetical protein